MKDEGYFNINLALSLASKLYNKIAFIIQLKYIYVVVGVVEFAVTSRASECGVKHTMTADVIDFCTSSNRCLL